MTDDPRPRPSASSLRRPRAVQLRITGRVQGVYFRDSCRRTAEVLGVSGSCENLEDGSVRARLFGDEASVAAVIEWCRSGPPLAAVEGVEILELDPATTLTPTDFTTR
jgi:acylphosphatase